MATFSAGVALLATGDVPAAVVPGVPPPPPHEVRRTAINTIRIVIMVMRMYFFT
jgi:hypothetical protein